MQLALFQSQQLGSRPALVQRNQKQIGAGAVEADAAGLGVSAHFSLMGALLLLTGLFAPFAITTALRISLE